MERFQLWLNLPRRARWPTLVQDYASEKIPEYRTRQRPVRVIAGSSNGVADWSRARSPSRCIWTSISSGRVVFDRTARDAQCLRLRLSRRGAGRRYAVEAKRMGILSNAPEADGVTLSATEDARLILIAASR